MDIIPHYLAKAGRVHQSLTGVVCDGPVFLPVQISPDNSVVAPLSDAARTAACDGCLGRVEIILSDGVRVKVEGGFDGGELGRLVKGLIA